MKCATFTWTPCQLALALRLEQPQVPRLEQPQVPRPDRPPVLAWVPVPVWARAPVWALALEQLQLRPALAKRFTLPMAAALATALHRVPATSSKVPIHPAPSAAQSDQWA